MAEVLAIDFGTTHTVAAVCDGAAVHLLSFDDDPLLPSGVLFERGELVAGNAAERWRYPRHPSPEMFLAHPKLHLDADRWMFGPHAVPIANVVAAVFAEVAEAVRARWNGSVPERVVLTHPAGWPGHRLQVLRDAAELAGLGEVSLLPEPLAVALHRLTTKGPALRAGAALAVYDLGGGTFDAAVVVATAADEDAEADPDAVRAGDVVLQVASHGGDDAVGGAHFDERMLGRVRERHYSEAPGVWDSIEAPQTKEAFAKRRKVLEYLREAKEVLDERVTVSFPLPYSLTRKRWLRPNWAAEAAVTRGEFKDMIAGDIARTATILARTIADAGLSPDRLEAIYTVGGSSRIPLVHDTIRAALEVQPVLIGEPEHVVALGAAATGLTATTGPTAATGVTAARASAESRAAREAPPRILPTREPGKPTVLGIDFGTTHTVAALSDGAGVRVLLLDGRESLLPSSVLRTGGGELVAGRTARRAAALAPEMFVEHPKMHIDFDAWNFGGDEVPMEEVVGAVFSKVAQEARRQYHGAVPERVVLTHPAGWHGRRLEVLRRAARLAGLGEVGLLAEPVAAAAHRLTGTGQRLREGAAVAIYDLGGGTFDAGVVEVTPVDRAGHPDGTWVLGRDAQLRVAAERGAGAIGGAHFDARILAALRERHYDEAPTVWEGIVRPQTREARTARRLLLDDIRGAKEGLSDAEVQHIMLPGHAHDTTLTRREFNDMIETDITNTVTIMAETIDDAGLSPERIDAIYTVGGSSRIPLVHDTILSVLGKQPLSLGQAEHVVALGAAASGIAATAPGTAGTTSG